MNFQRMILVGMVCVALAMVAADNARGDVDLRAELSELRSQVARQSDHLADLEKQIHSVGAPSKDSLKVYWNSGIRFDSADKAFRLRIGGRIHTDFAFGDVQDGDYGDGAKFRRARLYMSGLMYDLVEFKAQYDFAAGGDNEIRDLYMGLIDLPVNLRIGHFKEPFGLEELTSSNNITFQERSMPVEAFAPSRQIGMMLHGCPLTDYVTFAVGGFRVDTGGGITGRDTWGSGGEYALTGRLTWLPYYACEGAQLVHVGAGYSHRWNEKDEARFRSRPEVNMHGRVVDTGTIVNGSETGLANAEVAAVFGPLSVQGEYYHANVNRIGADNPSFAGYYVYGSWFLTGENRNYSKSSGAFSSIKPRRNFFSFEDGFCGPGAWELGLRYSHLDLNDKDIEGGKATDYTLGVNWYLNPMARWMFNYVYADTSKARFYTNPDDRHLLTMRFQVVF